MNIRKIAVCLLLLTFAVTGHADLFKCEVCGKVITGRWFNVEDQMDGKKKVVCEDCQLHKERCFLCNLPVGDNSKNLPDGRYICGRDFKDVVLSDAQAKEICSGVKDDLDRLYSRFISFPGDNVELSIVDKYHLENLFHAPGYRNSCVSIYGATAGTQLPNGKYHHSVDILSYLPKSRLMAVCAHEYTHTWVNENVKYPRRGVLDKNTHEAFCELVAYKYMESLHDEAMMASIRSNTYTVGQIQVLLEADAKYGFNTVAEWIKYGEDSTITMDNLDRIRFVKDGATTPKPVTVAAYEYVPPAAPTHVPSTLILKGISGTGQHRFALINDATMEATERARVRVGQTNVIVRCLEIRANSVVVEIAGAKEKKELFISTK